MNPNANPQRLPHGDDTHKPGCGEAKPEPVVSAGCQFRACARHSRMATNGREARLLLLLGWREASLYRVEVTGGIPEKLLPLPAGEGVASKCSYEMIAQALQTPGKILVSAKPGTAIRGLRHFILWLARMHPRLSARIVGLLPLAHAVLSPAQLLAKAREFDARPVSSSGPRAGSHI
jgi:hypothetical protein